MSSPKAIAIGSRASDLAMWQARYIRDTLLRQHPQLRIEIRIVHTTGDKNLDSSLAAIGGKGVFTKEIEQELLAGTIDIAVHSLKDLPTEMVKSLILGAVPTRASVEDVFLSNDRHAHLMDLPDNATIATGSLRRIAQLRTKRPDFRIVDIRGNVPTRIRKLRESEWDGMILAAAGLERLGLTRDIVHPISLEWILPAAGQGALGIQCRTADTDTLRLLAPLNDAGTLAAVTAERALLAGLGGGCQAPIGAHGFVSNGVLELTACIASTDGSSLVRAVHTGHADHAKNIGEELAKTLLISGGAEILDDVMRNSQPLNGNPEA